jgi:ribonuclease HII
MARKQDMQVAAREPDGPTLELEKKAGFPAKRIAGVDEAGRGPLAGPVVAAAVLLDPGAIPDGLNDSKKLSAAKREKLFDEICASSHYAIALGAVEEIDRLNIHHATLQTMKRAVEALPFLPDHVLVDGKFTPALACPAEAVIGGDGRSLSIAAASILAKVARDRLMLDLDAAHPGYGWARNMGYGTAAHKSALEALGPTIHHRRSFAPIRKILSPDS